MNKQTRVFILGAGCSKECGYPLGNGLKHQLQEFYWKIPTDCTRIEQSVRRTIALMERLPRLDTLDQLAKHLEEELAALSPTRKNDAELIEMEKRTDTQIVSAKIATSAMFVTQEEKAFGAGLKGYRRLIDSVFGGEPWQDSVADSDCHVLTFNYDRVFEITFLDSFKSLSLQRFSVYDGTVLNAGFNSNDFSNRGYRKVEPAPHRFCFLKLHGSAGWWVKTREGNKSNPNDELRLYWPSHPEVSVNLHKFEELLGMQWEPLIAFPHEKQRAVKGSADFLADRYLERTEAQAAGVLATATEVRIIGYSFAPIDSRHVVNNMLNKVPESARITVQNTDVATVRSRLDAYPTLRGRVEFDPTPF